MKMSDCFREAAEVISQGRARFCCYAVLAVNDRVGNRCAKVINERIAPYYTVSNWLRWKHGITTRSETRMQDYRRRWLLSLADEFEAKGK